MSPAGIQSTSQVLHVNVFSYHSKCNNDIIYRELLLSFTETLQGLRELDIQGLKYE